ncbi:MAG: methylisocitrate lyase [Deltaproteobacteria bacterium]|nr:methylisocitrate lyase [Deltaproteobacteria bacterium]
MKKTAQFRKLLAGGTVVMPGVFNAYAAMLVEAAGFAAYYVSGAGLANAVFGRPDVGLTTLKEATEHAARIDQAVAIPGISDADTGFGGPKGMAKAVRAFESTGIAGIHLEDQWTDKRCGHLEGKKLVTIDAMAAKIETAAKGKSEPDFLVIARTDARAVEGLESAIERAKAYVAAGADAIFAEALQSEEEFRAFRKAIDIPLLANMTEFGKTPSFTVDEFRAWGYNMVIFPMTLFRISAKTIQEALAELKTRGTQQGLLPRMQTRAELYQLLKYTP